MKKDSKCLDTPKYRPAITPETREKQCIALAFDLAEQRLRDGTATSQEVCHFLKLGSIREQEERELMRIQMDKLKAQTATLESVQKTEEMYEKALHAFGRYAGKPMMEDAEDANI